MRTTPLEVLFILKVALKGSGRTTSIPSVVERLRLTLSTDPNSPTWWDYSAIVDTTKSHCGLAVLDTLELELPSDLFCLQVCVSVVESDKLRITHKHRAVRSVLIVCVYFSCGV